MGGAPSKAEPRAARIEKGFAELIAADYENLQQQVTRQYAQLECNETTDAQVLELCQRYKQRYLEVLKILNQYRNLDPLQVLYQLDDIIANFDSDQPIVDEKISKLKRLLLIEELEVLQQRLDQAAAAIEQQPAGHCQRLEDISAELNLIVARLEELSQRAAGLTL